MVVGKAYVKSTLASCIKKISSSKKIYELDSTKSGHEESKQKIGDFVREILKSIAKSADNFPTELRSLVQYMSTELSRKLGETSNTAIQNFLFSRLFIPAILDPTNWSVVKESMGSEGKRNCITVSKILNSVATGSIFEDKNPFSTFNITIKKYQSRLADFIYNIVSSSPETQVKDDNVVTPEVSEAAFQCIHFCLYLWKDHMANYRNSVQKVTTHEAKIFFDLFGVLEETELAEGKPEIGDTTLLGYDKSATFKTLSKASIRPKAPNTNKKQEKSGRVPYVRQQSEHWNREHQKFLVEQKKRESEQKELQARKMRNAYQRKQSEGSLKLSEKKEISQDLQETQPVEVEKSPETVEITITPEVNEEVSEKVESGAPTPKKKKKKDKEAPPEVTIIPLAKLSKGSDELLSPKLTPQDVRDRSSSFSVKTKTDRYMDYGDAQYIKDLNNEINRLQMEKDIFLKEIEHLRESFKEYKTQSTKKLDELYNYNSNLIKSIMYRRQKNDDIRKQVLLLKRTHHPSLDDDMFDFAGTSPDERRRILLEALNYRPNEVFKPKYRKSELQRDKCDRMDSLERVTQKIIDEVDSEPTPSKKDSVPVTPMEGKKVRSPGKKLKKTPSKKKTTTIRKMPSLG